MRPRNPISPRGPIKPKTYGFTRATRSLAAMRARAKQPKNGILDQAKWEAIKKQKAQDEAQQRDQLSYMQGLSPQPLSTATFEQATLDVPAPGDPRATNLTNFPSADEGFLPPAPK